MMDVYRKTVSWMGKLAAAAVLLFFFAVPVQSQTCQFYIDLYDSFGDGWNSCSLTVKVNGVNTLTNITLGSGYGPARFSFTADVGDVITTVFTAVSWPEECSYRLLDGNNNQLLSSGPQTGGPPNISYTAVTTACVAPPVVTGCEYTIRMWDEYGDGWNGCSVDIYINGVKAYPGLTLASGLGPIDHKFNVDNGDSIHVTFNSVSWPDECEFWIYDKNMNVIYKDGLNYTIPVAKYTFVGIGACTYDLELYDAILGYADDTWTRLEAPGANPVMATLYDVDGTMPSYVKAVYKLGGMPADSTDGVAEGFNLDWSFGDYTTIEFSQKLTTLALGSSPAIYVKVFHPEDGDTSNDGGMAPTVQVFDARVKGYEDFNEWEVPLLGPAPSNTLGWSMTDPNGGGFWQSVFWPPMALGHPGDPNDWVFTPAASLDMSASYRVDGEILLAAPDAVIELAYGTSPDPAAMTVFATFSAMNIYGPTPFSAVAPGGYAPYFNTPPMAGDYYIGVHMKAGTVVLNWLKLDENPSPPPKIGYGYPGSDISQFIDDPNIPISITALYKQPGKINKTYEVSTTTDIFGINGDFLWDVESSDTWISLTKATPEPTLQGFNFTPPRPRQFQTFTMTIDPSGLAPGLHIGTLRFYGVLFNDDFPPPAMGLTATNEIFEVPVHLRITTAGTKNGPTMVEATIGGLTVAGSPYKFIDGNSGATIATVNVTAGSIPSLTVKAYPNQLPQNLARLMYVRRYWEFEYTGTGWNADITFPYAAQEASMVTDPTQLRGVRQPVPMGMWEDPTMGTSSVSDAPNYEVTVNNISPANADGYHALAHSYFILSKNDKAVPDAFGMEQNYPNPFNPSTAITYNVAEERHVRIAVFNSLGAEVAVLVDETMPAGQYTVDFDAADLTSGTYIYRMSAGDFTQTRRMTLSK